MRLYEFEGKQLLKQNGIIVPEVIALATLPELTWQQPCVLKAQVLFGNRASQGLIQVVATNNDWEAKTSELTTKLQALNLPLEDTLILVEPLVEYSQEILVGVRYDTRFRQPVIYLNEQGGSGIEARSENNNQTSVYPITTIPPRVPNLTSQLDRAWLQQLLDIFWQQDLQLLEINPVVLVNHQPIALDAKLELDDQAAFRHEAWQEYKARSLFNRDPTEAEKQAKQINDSDHRGVAGASYFDLDGNIGILAAGGGASILAMDTLLSLDLKPANYTEYSGNPTREKVAALTKVVLQKENLQALWVVGGHANFTDQYETLMGVMDGIEKSHITADFPVVIRRGGPRLEEAFQSLHERNQKLKLNLQLFSSDIPIPESALALKMALSGETS